MPFLDLKNMRNILSENKLVTHIEGRRKNTVIRWGRKMECENVGDVLFIFSFQPIWHVVFHLVYVAYPSMSGTICIQRTLWKKKNRNENNVLVNLFKVIDYFMGNALFLLKGPIEILYFIL